MEYTIGVLNKEHYKAIIDRLDELGYDTHTLGSNPYDMGYIVIEGKNVHWSRYDISECTERVTLEDLYTDRLKPKKKYEVGVSHGPKEVNVMVNEHVAATVLQTERYNKENRSLIFLWDSVGAWTDKNGNKVSGYLTFEPNY